jgi:predicted Fe-Mo cluster-binding NifX family protein
MKIAIPLFGSVVSPRFDFAREMLVATCAGGKVVERETLTLPCGRPLWTVALLRDLGVTIVICGGISAFSGRLLAGHGIEVIPLAAGPAEAILCDFLKEGPTSDGRLLSRRCRRRQGRERRHGGPRRGSPMRGHRWPPMSKTGRSKG